MSNEIELHRLSCLLRNIYGDVIARLPVATAADLFTYTGFIAACILPETLQLHSQPMYLVSLEHLLLPTTNFLIVERQTKPEFANVSFVTRKTSRNHDSGSQNHPQLVATNFSPLKHNVDKNSSALL